MSKMKLPWERKKVTRTIDYIRSRGFYVIREKRREGENTEIYRILGKKSNNLVARYDRRRKVATIFSDRTPGRCPTIVEVLKLRTAFKREFIEYKVI